MSDEITDEQFAILVKTMDKFDAMLSGLLGQIRELREYFQLANTELAMHSKRLTAIERRLNGN